MTPARAVPLLLLGALIGCSHNPSDDELARVYPSGMTRAEATDAFGLPMTIKFRPQSGWAKNDASPERIAEFAGRFESTHAAIVQTCKVYWISHGVMGVWWDYLYFGADDRLLGFERRLMD